jgi:hypothetical protein
MYAIKRIICINGDGEQSVGTGFAYKDSIYNGNVFRMIITNHHVVKNAVTIRFQFHILAINEGVGAVSGKTVYLEVPAENNVIVYPGNVDLCAININGLMARWDQDRDSEKIFTAYVERETFLDEEYVRKLDVAEPIMMIGCPNGLWDEPNGFPICRMGHTATHPAIDYRGRPEFLIDTAVFSGSSGSPVFLYDFNRSYRKPNDLAGAIKFGFLGVLWGGPVISATGQISSAPISTDADESANISASHQQVQVHTRMHIGYVIKCREVKVLIETYKQYVESLWRKQDT